VLDIRTLFVAQVAVIVTAGTIMLLSRQWQPGARSVGIWGAGGLCLGIGMALASLRGSAPDWLTVLIANGILVMAPLSIWNGIRKFNGSRTFWREIFALDAVFIAVVAYFVYIDRNLSIRIALGSAVLAWGCGASAYELFRRTNPALRRMSWTAATALSLVVVVHTARAAIALFGPPQSSLFAPTSVNAISYLAGIVVSSLIIFCLTMMATLQLQLELGERTVELERIARDRDEARQRAEQANRAKTTFLTTMSHELRTPLNAILGFSELGPTIPSDAPLPARIGEYFGLIHQSGAHLLRMINDILDLSKVEAGKMEIECADLEIGYVINSTVRLVAPQADGKAQRLEAAIDEPHPPLYADERAMRQILFNLLSNAVRFTPDSGTVRVTARAAAGGGTEIVVSDTGIGIPHAEIPRLTKPFEQIDNSYARAHGGTGLGLPLVDGLVRLHGGKLTIDSEVDAGTRVALWFPPRPESAA
jgi:signal transduction histidine kinase